MVVIAMNKQLHEGVLSRLRAEGVTLDQYQAALGYQPGEPWAGDVCGCPDDRCMGSHHSVDEPCGCFLGLLEEVAAIVTEEETNRTEIRVFVGLLSEPEREWLLSVLSGDSPDDEMKGVICHVEDSE